METQQIIKPSLFFVHASLTGEEVQKSRKTLSDLKDVFLDEQAYAGLPAETPVYEVSSYVPAGCPLPGALNFGLTKIYPGRVGQEYFMTRGHFHALADAGEYYWGLEGEGILLLMDRKRNSWGERMFPGSLHYIPGHTAHRVINTGKALLSFAACWPSDAGHDYESIARNGFSARLLEINGTPQLIKNV